MANILSVCSDFPRYKVSRNRSISHRYSSSLYGLILFSMTFRYQFQLWLKILLYCSELFCEREKNLVQKFIFQKLFCIIRNPSEYRYILRSFEYASRRNSCPFGASFRILIFQDVFPRGKERNHVIYEFKIPLFPLCSLLMPFRIWNLRRNSSNVSNKCWEGSKGLRDAVIFYTVKSYRCFDISEDRAGNEKVFSIDFYHLDVWASFLAPPFMKDKHLVTFKACNYVRIEAELYSSAISISSSAVTPLKDKQRFFSFNFD